MQTVGAECISPENDPLQPTLLTAYMCGLLGHSFGLWGMCDYLDLCTVLGFMSSSLKTRKKNRKTASKNAQVYTMVKKGITKDYF